MPPKTRTKRSRKQGPAASRPTPTAVIASLLLCYVLPGALKALVEGALGESLAAFAWHTALSTLPLTIGFAAISLLVGYWLIERFAKGWELLLYVLVVFDISGFLGTLGAGRLAPFLAAYGDLLPGSTHVFLKIPVYAVLSLVGFYQAYGPTEFFASLVVGLVAPWVGLAIFAGKYEEQEKKLSGEG